MLEIKEINSIDEIDECIEKSEAFSEFIKNSVKDYKEFWECSEMQSQLDELDIKGIDWETLEVSNYHEFISSIKTSFNRHGYRGEVRRLMDDEKFITALCFSADLMCDYTESECANSEAITKWVNYILEELKETIKCENIRRFKISTADVLDHMLGSDDFWEYRYIMEDQKIIQVVKIL